MDDGLKLQNVAGLAVECPPTCIGRLQRQSAAAFEGPARVGGASRGGPRRAGSAAFDSRDLLEPRLERLPL